MEMEWGRERGGQSGSGARAKRTVLGWDLEMGLVGEIIGTRDIGFGSVVVSVVVVVVDIF